MHHDWSEQVHYVSIKHVRYVTRVHCRDIINAITMNLIKEIKKLFLGLQLILLELLLHTYII